MNLLRLLILSLCWFTPHHLHAKNNEKNLQQIYELAIYRDPTLQAAYALLQANRQAFPEALAQMAPNLSANYSATANDTSTAYASPFVFAGHYNTKSYGLTLSQPIYHPELWAQLERSRHIVKGAVSAYLSADQALIIRVAEQYFNILGAIDDLNYTIGKTKAFSRQYEQTKQRFEVGLIAITDVETAKSRYDLAVAEEISAKNSVFDEYEKLREIIGEPLQQVTLFPITNSLPLLVPSPNDQEAWVQTANRQNLDITTAQENANQAKAVIGAQVAGHFPKVDVSGNLQRSKAAPPFADLTYDRSVTLNIAIPIFSGGGIIFQTKEATARYDQALQQLEVQRRSVGSATRQAYRGVLSAISSVEAFKQAVISNQSAVTATNAGYEVGTRTIIDVLDAESNLLSAERDHAKARYNYLLEGLKLKQAAGVLCPEDLCAVNQLILGNK